MGTASIYNWLNRGWLTFKLADLPNRNVRQRRVNEHRGKSTNGTSIEQRPQNVNQRLAFGHWEVDTILLVGVVWSLSLNVRHSFYEPVKLLIEPKKTDFIQVTTDEILAALELINDH